MSFPPGMQKELFFVKSRHKINLLNSTFWRNFQKSTKFDFTKKAVHCYFLLKKSLISRKNQKDKIIHFLVKLPQLSFRFSLFSFDHFFFSTAYNCEKPPSCPQHHHHRFAAGGAQFWGWQTTNMLDEDWYNVLKTWAGIPNYNGAP